MSLLHRHDDRVRELGQAVGILLKTAGDAEAAPVMSGRLYLSSSGWLMLSVPNALVNGIFASLDEEGLEIPPGKNGKPYNAHISVMRPDEVAVAGGGEAITERGKTFHYQFGPLKTVAPSGWDEMSKVWFVEVKSPELQNLRKSYGLPALPHKGEAELQFHITVAVRRKKVLQQNDVKKAAGYYADALKTTPFNLVSGGFLANLKNHLGQVHDRGTTAINEAYGAQRLRTAFLPSHLQQLARSRQMLQGLEGRDPILADPIDSTLFKISSDLPKLHEAKARSDRKDYRSKHLMLRQLIAADPAAWHVDSRQGGMLGITHRTGYRFHVPPAVAASLSGG